MRRTEPDRRFSPQEFIRAKRDRQPLSARDIAQFVDSVVSGDAADVQIAAFAMAATLNGLDDAECAALTHAMATSGRTVRWTHARLGRARIDKHSTGGVGDKVSLILAPLAAAAGLAVPMVSGRGLGHTGGTLDKLESIPGYDCAASTESFVETVGEVGCAIVAAGADLAPADARMYAIRDVTATVESIGLITASILSKKLAAGIEGLVMDVKTGSGAFAASRETARALAGSIVRVAGEAGLPARALVTDMNEVLGTSAGNALEVAEAVRFLTGEHRDSRLEEVVLALGAEMLALGDPASACDANVARLRVLLDAGAAAEIFGRMVHGRGGPADLVERHAAYLEPAPVRVDVVARTSGVVIAQSVRDIGVRLVALGAGRSALGQRVDHAVGISDVAAIGTAVAQGERLCTVHARDTASAGSAVAALERTFEVAEGDAGGRRVVLERISPDA